MNIFEFKNYKEFVDSWVKSKPKVGHGQYKKIADALGMSTVMISQVFSSDRHLSVEHAYELAEYLGLNDLEKEYFLALVQYERAGSFKLQNHFKNLIKQIILKSKDLKKLLPQDMELTEAEKATFHSNWYYSAIRLLTSIEGYKSIDQIAERLQLNKSIVSNVIQFLIQHGLCEEKNGEYRLGPNRTHLEADSPYIKTRQMSWRVKGFERMDNKSSEQLFLTAPMSISNDQYEKLRAKISEVMAELSKSVVKEKPEKLICFNVDLFEV